MSGPARPSSRRWALAAFLLATVFGSLFALVTPPSQAPDEPAHFRRAYAVSEGRLVAVRRDGRVGNDVPRSVVLVSHDFLDGLPFHPETKQRPRAILEGFRTPLQADDRQFIAFPNAALHGPLAYAPQAAAIALGRVATRSVLALFYAGRLGNVAAGSVLLGLACAAAPVGRPVLLLVGLLPMAVFQMSSLSADGPTNALAFLWIALVLRFAVGPGRGPVSGAGAAGLFSAAVLLGLMKPGYAPLAALVFLIPRGRIGTGRAAGFVRWGVLLAALVAGTVWAAAAIRLLPVRPDPAGWIRRSAALLGGERPDRTVLLEAVRSAGRVAVQLVGKLGWADVSLPIPVVLAAAGVLLFAAVGSGSDTFPYFRARILLAGVSLGTFLVLAAPYYIPIFPPGPEGSAAHHFHGRYLLPLAPAALLVLARRRSAIDWDRRLVALCLWAGLVLVAALAAVVARYYF